MGLRPRTTATPRGRTCSTRYPSGDSRFSTTIWLMGSSSTDSTMQPPYFSLGRVGEVVGRREGRSEERKGGNVCVAAGGGERERGGAGGPRNRSEAQMAWSSVRMGDRA